MSVPMTPAESPAPAPRTADEIRDWLVTRLSDALKVAPGEVRTDEPLTESGLDSMQFVALVGELEERVGCRFTGNPLIAHPTIDALAPWLAARLAAGAKVIDPSER